MQQPMGFVEANKPGVAVAQVVQAPPQMVGIVAAPGGETKIGNEGTLRMKMFLHDYDGKRPADICKFWRPWEVSSHIHGTSKGTMLLKEDPMMTESACCDCNAPKADSTARLFQGADEKRDQEIYRMHQPAPSADPMCVVYGCQGIEWQTDVMATDPSKPMKMIGFSKVNYKIPICGCDSPWSDISVVNKETGTRFTIPKVPTLCLPCCHEGDITLPITMNGGQEVGRLVKEKNAVVGCCGQRMDLQFPTFHLQKKVALTDDDQALLIAGAHQSNYMRRLFRFIQPAKCCAPPQVWNVFGYVFTGMGGGPSAGIVIAIVAFLFAFKVFATLLSVSSSAGPYSGGSKSMYRYP